MTFGERLKKARIDSGINQADAAKKLEMSRPTLSAIEADKRQVLASEILQFAELYNVSVLSLMSDEEIGAICKEESNDQAFAVSVRFSEDE